MLKTTSGQTALVGLEKKLTGNTPDDSDVPGPVRRAVRLILSGGALTALIGVFLVIATIADKNALTNSSGKKLTNGEFTSSLVGTVIVYVILVTMWVLMARMNRAGRGWARIIASVLAILSTINAYSTINSLTGGETLTVIDIVFIVGTLALWLIGVLAVALLWRTESSAYFRARSTARL
ncbi:MAG TPA: hypothetical protein VF838_06330 [Trebonia sp.]